MKKTTIKSEVEPKLKSTEVQERKQYTLSANEENQNKVNSSETIPIVGTPFTGYTDGNSWYLMMGNKRLNPVPFETSEELIAYMKSDMYNIILKMVIIATEQIIEIDKIKLREKHSKSGQETAEKVS